MLLFVAEAVAKVALAFDVTEDEVALLTEAADALLVEEELDRGKFLFNAGVLKTVLATRG